MYPKEQYNLKNTAVNLDKLIFSFEWDERFAEYVDKNAAEFTLLDKRNRSAMEFKTYVDSREYLYKKCLIISLNDVVSLRNNNTLNKVIHIKVVNMFLYKNLVGTIEKLNGLIERFNLGYKSAYKIDFALDFADNILNEIDYNQINTKYLPDFENKNTDNFIYTDNRVKKRDITAVTSNHNSVYFNLPVKDRSKQECSAILYSNKHKQDNNKQYYVNPDTTRLELRLSAKKTYSKEQDFLRGLGEIILQYPQQFNSQLPFIYLDLLKEYQFLYSMRDLNGDEVLNYSMLSGIINGYFTPVAKIGKNIDSQLKYIHIMAKIKDNYMKNRDLTRNKRTNQKREQKKRVIDQNPNNYLTPKQIEGVEVELIARIRQNYFIPETLPDSILEKICQKHELASNLLDNSKLSFETYNQKINECLDGYKQQINNYLSAKIPINNIQYPFGELFEVV